MFFSFRRRAPRGRKASPSDFASPSLSLPDCGLSGAAVGDYRRRSREGYMRNPAVYRCIRMIAEAAASLVWTLHEGDREYDRHPLLDLLARPHPDGAGAALMEAFYISLQLDGNAYMRVIAIDGVPRELHNLRPDRMRITTDRHGRLSGYEHRLGAGAAFFPYGGDGLSPIFHCRLFSPLDDHYGLSPIAAAALAVDLHGVASSWNKALLDNGARPSGALVYRGERGADNLPPQAVDRLKRELETLHQGARNAGRPMLLEGGLDWKPMAFTPRDMDYNECRNAAARDIALAFGVPPMLLGIPGDNTYANYAEANRVFWRQTVLPLAARAAQGLSSWLGPAYGGSVRLDFDLDRIQALQEERRALWDRVGAADFLTDDEKRAAVGYGDLPSGGGDGSSSSA